MQHLKFDFKFEKCSDGGNKRPERSAGGGKKSQLEEHLASS